MKDGWDNIGNMKTVNDVDKLYKKPIKKLKNGIFLCPVCEKDFQTERGAEIHKEKKECHTLKHLVEGTIHEGKGFGLYQEIVGSINPKARVTLATFRKSTFYKPMMRFILFCVLHQVFDIRQYVDWLNQIKKIENLPKLLSVGTEEPILREFRDFAQLFELMDSQKFFDKYKEKLEEDDDFFIRSIEKGLISLSWLSRLESYDIDSRVERLPIDYKNRLFVVAGKLA